MFSVLSYLPLGIIPLCTCTVAGYTACRRVLWEAAIRAEQALVR